MSFDPNQFLKSTDLETSFEGLKKDELLILADHLKVPVNPRMKKSEIKPLWLKN